MVPGLFVTLEGVDGAGKSSHLEWLADWFRARGRVVRQTREPGGTPLGERLREIVLHQAMHPDTEALVMFAARREHIEQVIRPALAAGEVLISDRFTDASFAYQCGGRGLPEARLEVLENWVLGDLQPDLTLLFDVPTEIAAARLANAREPDRFEREQGEFHARVRAAYLRRAAAHRERIRVIDGSRTLERVRIQLAGILEPFA
ncbi:MAG: dTMP kinase [Hydrogenophilales bacterium CG17_big_fil_post_rev_8_21_14_2_50_63_12]|nr:MAG: dTMP kinase [Hydrogenophilales bacterium CG17_big_fil_post_rev_8_21_14_2_50_63_12]PIX97265.1 MAG: dTMP kinase [Hydrogenophilales bacterium CG_4_10_14_3_um_filter_63_21]PJB06863.1 MAG: dTMP kinase [Hydrogenophilales bacterium CG_4_9_14_3_um_filter_63_34]